VTRTHILRNQQASGAGKWKQCIDCGATTNGGYWWLGGYKSKDEPPCNQYGGDAEWQKNATSVAEDCKLKERT